MLVLSRFIGLQCMSKVEDHTVHMQYVCVVISNVFITLHSMNCFYFSSYTAPFPGQTQWVSEQWCDCLSCACVSLPRNQDTVSVHVFEWLDAMIQHLKCENNEKLDERGKSLFKGILVFNNY